MVMYRSLRTLTTKNHNRDRSFFTAAATSIIPFPYTTSTFPLHPLHFSPSPHPPPRFFSPLSKWIAPFQGQRRGPLFLSSPPWKLLQSATPLYLRGNAVVLRKVEVLNLNLLRTRIRSGFSGQNVLDRVQQLKEGAAEDGLFESFVNLPNFISLTRLVSGPLIGWYSFFFQFFLFVMLPCYFPFGYLTQKIEGRETN